MGHFPISLGSLHLPLVAKWLFYMLVCVVIDPNGCSSHALFLKLTVLKSTRIEFVNYFLISFVYGQGHELNV